MKRIVAIPAAIFCAVAMTACVNISYDGTSGEPLPDAQKVTMFFSKEQLPAKGYTIMGKLTATAGTSYSAAEVEAKIKKFAREKGANGVLIIDIKRIFEGEARTDQVKNQPSYRWTTDDTSGSAFRFFREDMLTYSKKEGPEKPVYDITINAELLTLTEDGK